MIKKTLPFLLAAALGLSASAMVQAAGTAPKSKSVPLSQQVQDLRETVLQLQKQVDYLEMLVPPSTAVLMPDARKLSSIRVPLTNLPETQKAVILFSLSSTRKALLIPMSLLISACTEKTPTGTRTLIKTLCWFPVSRRLSHRARQHSSVLPHRACRLKTSRPLMLLP